MKLLQMLLEMPLKQIKKGTIRNVTSNKEYSEYTNFRTTDITVIDKKLADGSYHLALAKLPFDFYVYISDMVNNQRKEEGLSWAKAIMKKNPNAVVFLLCNNNSDNHIPLTPWMIIHRFFQEGSISDYSKSFDLINIYDKHESIFINSGGRRAAIISACEMKSVKSKNGLSDELEIGVEIPTEIAITGKLRRNLDNGVDTVYHKNEFNTIKAIKLRKSLESFFNNVEKEYIEYFKTLKGIFISNYFNRRDNN